MLMNDSFWLLYGLDFLLSPRDLQRVNLLIRLSVESAGSGDKPEDRSIVVHMGLIIIPCHEKMGKEGGGKKRLMHSLVIGGHATPL